MIFPGAPSAHPDNSVQIDVNAEPPEPATESNDNKTNRKQNAAMAKMPLVFIVLSLLNVGNVIVWSMVYSSMVVNSN
jgi:hypothetical protein